jgi:hypothetical protein
MSTPAMILAAMIKLMIICTIVSMIVSFIMGMFAYLVCAYRLLYRAFSRRE